MIEIEKLKEKDWSRLKSLRLEALKQDPKSFATTLETALSWDDENWKNQIKNIPTFFAHENQMDLGMVRAGSDPDNPEDGWLISMWVSNQTRGKGIGGKLIDALVDFCKQQNYKRILLDVGDFNQAAIALYAKKGFQPNGKKAPMPPPNENIMEHQRELPL